MLYGAIEYIDCLILPDYPLCLINSRKGNWWHQGSSPWSGTDQANWIASSSQVIRLVLALVAQQTEQVSPKDKVAGAIPVKGTAKEVYPTSLLPRLPLLFSQMV